MASELQKELGRRLRAHREARGWTQDDLMARMGITSRGSTSRVESGQQGVSVGRLMHWAEALGVDPAALVQGLSTDSYRVEMEMDEVMEAALELPIARRQDLLDVLRELARSRGKGLGARA